MSDRTFNEAGELFGARPDAGAPMDLQVLMYSLTDEATAEPGLRKAMVLADEFQGEAYGKMLPAAFDLMGQGVDFEKLRAFFHLAAAFGEARYVGRFLSNLHLAVLLKSPPTSKGDA